MKKKSMKIMVVILFLMPLLGCSKSETKLVGTWINENTSSSIEFNGNKTGIIHQRSQANVPTDLTFTWTMLKDDQFQIQVNLPGSSTMPTALGRLEGNDTLILEKDTFKRKK